MKIYAPKDHVLTQKALIAAKYGNIDIEQTPTFEFGKDNKTPEFLAKNPLGKVPVLETDEGCIWESNAIARYVARLDANTHLFGSNAYENALVEQWIDFAGAEINLPLRVWIYPILGHMENHPEATNKAKADIRKVLTILNDYLADKTFLVGERVTLADIVVSLSLVYLYKLVLDPGFRKPFVNTNRWFLTCVHQPHFHEVLGEVTLCSKMSVAKSSQPEEKKKQEQPKKEKPKKQEQPKKKEKKPEEDDGGEDEDNEPKKAPNPLDLLPPSKFVLDDWKRFYSNNAEDASVKYFWENFDEEGWSLWCASYKYNDELDNLMRTCNLIGGMFQRLEKMIKYSFASVAILKENDDSKTFQIKGIWVIRGKEIPELMKICDDYELYDWVRLDPKDESVKSLVNEYWKWDGNFEGKKFVQGKILK